MLLFFVNSEGGRQNIKASLLQEREREKEKESGHEFLGDVRYYDGPRLLEESTELPVESHSRMCLRRGSLFSSKLKTNSSRSWHR